MFLESGCASDVSPQITGLEEPMYHARVLVANKLRKHDLSVKSGDVISIIRTVNCPKGKWLARDVNNKCETGLFLTMAAVSRQSVINYVSTVFSPLYCIAWRFLPCFEDGYISVMNVELNIKEMLELGKRASHAAGRGQTDGDNLSFSSRWRSILLCVQNVYAIDFGFMFDGADILYNGTVCQTNVMYITQWFDVKYLNTLKSYLHSKF